LRRTTGSTSLTELLVIRASGHLPGARSECGAHVAQARTAPTSPGDSRQAVASPSQGGRVV
jgi:hypothetical protein